MDFQDVVAEPLTATIFAPFGRLVLAGSNSARPVNSGTADRIDLGGHFSHTTGAALPTLAIYRCRAQPSPVTVPLLERHKLTSQTFLPLRVARWLIVVAPSGLDGLPEPTGAQAFIAGIGHGVTYAAGIWHSPLIALDQPAELTMLMWETGGSADCEVFPLLQPFHVRF